MLLVPLLVACSGQRPASTMADGTAVQPVFCYRSLADIDCYLVEDRERPAQLVGTWYRPVSEAPGAPVVLR
ncbi:MAG: hypothetical protein U1E14_02705 [Geminicoccaceae bacterium]